MIELLIIKERGVSFGKIYTRFSREDLSSVGGKIEKHIRENAWKICGIYIYIYIYGYVEIYKEYIRYIHKYP